MIKTLTVRARMIPRDSWPTCATNTREPTGAQEAHVAKRRMLRNRSLLSVVLVTTEAAFGQSPDIWHSYL